MKRYLGIVLVAISVLLTFPMSSPAGGGHGHHSHDHGSDWGDFAAGLTIGILGMGVLSHIISPQPPPKLYLQPMPQEPVRPGYMYYCIYSNGYYPYTPGCPGGWVQVVPIPQPLPQR
jgi:hypothetical protein